jgi:hypothetical protein
MTPSELADAITQTLAEYHADLRHGRAGSGTSEVLCLNEAIKILNALGDDPECEFCDAAWTPSHRCAGLVAQARHDAMRP